MEQAAETVGSRLGRFLASQGISFYEFEKRTGFSHGLVGKIVNKGNDFGVKKLDTIFSCFPQLNPTWLVSGRESMLLGNPAEEEGHSNTNPGKDLFYSTREASKTQRSYPDKDYEFDLSRVEEDYMQAYGFTADEAKSFLSNIANNLKSGQFTASLERLIIFIENNASLTETEKKKIIRPIFELRSYLVHSVNQVLTSEAKYLGALDAIKLLAPQLQSMNRRPTATDATD
jgi:hypothetical protein